MKLFFLLLIPLSFAQAQPQLRIAVESSSSDESSLVSNIYMTAAREAIGQNQILKYEWNPDSANIIISFLFASLAPSNSYGQKNEELRVVACSMMLYYCIPNLNFKIGQNHKVTIFSARSIKEEKRVHTASVLEFISESSSSYAKFVEAWQEYLK